MRRRAHRRYYLVFVVDATSRRDHNSNDIRRYTSKHEKRTKGGYARTTSAFSTQPSAPPPSPFLAPGAIFTSPRPNDSRAT